MRIGNWCKKLSATLVAAGIFLPSISVAANIPLGDPSFEAYTVPPAVGYAYADEYRPTSAWIANQDMAGEDSADSNWLYDADYAENGSSVRRRPAPRTGNQAMHGFGYYSTQESGAVFEAGMTYTFSLWAQGDDDSTASSSRVWMYIFDGSVPFSETNSLTFARYAPDTGDFVNRQRAWTAAESKANWTQISLSFDAVAGGSYIGNPVGVGFWGASDNAVDDATLTVNPTVPEPATIILVGLGGIAFLAYRRRT